MKKFFILLLALSLPSSGDIFDEMKEEMKGEREKFYREAEEDRKAFLQEWFNQRDEIINDLRRIEREMKKRWTKREIENFWKSFEETGKHFVKVEKKENVKKIIDYDEGKARAIILLPKNVEKERAEKMALECAVESLAGAREKVLGDSTVGDKKAVKSIMTSENFKTEVKELKDDIQAVSVEIPLSSIVTAEPHKEITLQPLEKFDPSPYTGIIIDARNFQVFPCVAPVILSENGELVYGPQIPNYEYIRETGICGWVREVNTARPILRVGENPLVLRVSSVKGDGSLIISQEDARKVAALEREKEVLKKGRVVIAVP